MKNYEKRLKMEVVREENGKFVAVNVIDLDESYFTKFLEVFQGKDYNDKEIIDGVIKVQLNAKEGYNQLLNGIEYNGCRYEEIITTPSGMKMEEGAYKCESIFYNTDKYPNLKDEFYKVISADKLKNLYGKEIAINKKVSSRLALATSSIIGSANIDINRIFVAKEYEYDYLSKYSWFEGSELVEGERKLSHTFSDGQGLMSNEFAEHIKKSLGKDYRIDFAGVRLYSGLATKGVLLRFDFKSYYKSLGIETITDIYDEEWNIDDIDIIVNPSMVKWLDLHDNITDTIEYYENSKYKNINNKIYITKVNKADEKVKDRIRLNYQALTNTNISGEELISLAKDEIKSYKSINQYKNKDSLNLIRLALGCEESDNLLGLTLDKLGTEALELKAIRDKVLNSLEKKIKELSAGKILSNGYYCIAMTDPVAFCNKIIGMENELELQVGEIVQGGAEQGNRVCYRNPIAIYSEVHSITLSNRDYLKDYTKECLFINSKDDFMMLSSGAKR